MGHDGGVWARRPGGRVEPYLMAVDGEPLAKANFVFNDEQGRVWITVTTRSDPLSKAMTGLGQPECADGFVCLVDAARAPASSPTASPSPTRRASIRAAACSTWWRRRGAGSRAFASARPAICPAARPSRRFGHGTFADGIAFDAEGHLWVTSIVSNRLFRIAPDGKAALVFEDGNPEHIARVENALTDRSVTREHFY